MEEADLVVISKADLLTASVLELLKTRLAQAYPGVEISTISAKSGHGLDAWLDAVTMRSEPGRRIAEVDYDTYAEGEAVLGWLNATFTLYGEQTEWNLFAERLLMGLSLRFDNMGASVGHVKLMVEAGESFLIGNLTGKGDTLSIRGLAGTGATARLTLNARVQMEPETRGGIVREVVAAASQG